jgi:pyridoxal phosphate enzyme (YggS family)
MHVKDNLRAFKQKITGFDCTLIAVSKTYPGETIMEAYRSGQRDFGENRVQEMVEKHQQLPRDIRWHQIGHLQTNKVKFIAPFVHLVHSADSLKLLREIDKEGGKNNRVIDCLLQVYIASEETKFGLSFQEVRDLLNGQIISSLQHVVIRGLMGLATNTAQENQVRAEFRGLKLFFDELKMQYQDTPNIKLTELSMGMSSDYKVALQEGSTMIRVGSAIFGNRIYP